MITHRSTEVNASLKSLYDTVTFGRSITATTPVGFGGLFLVAVVILATLGRYFTSRAAKKHTVSGKTPPHILQFPPSRRHVLASLIKSRKSFGDFEIPPETLKSKALPTISKADLDRDDQFTPTGFSTQEIRAIGRFPDYSILAGVRHPEPVSPTWDISKAIFRPYRPFRSAQPS